MLIMELAYARMSGDGAFLSQYVRGGKLKWLFVRSLTGFVVQHDKEMGRLFSRRRAQCYESVRLALG